MTLEKKVLLVEDEALIRVIGTDALEEAGYDVLEAGSADEALEILEAYNEVLVLFTDIRMPGSLNGLELARIVHERWPKMKLLLTSGDTWPSENEIPDDGRFLPKPYRVETLRREIDEMTRNCSPTT
ncbi:response regulator receiver domain-containing protein [Novosphingobium sp. PhB57]|jgi:CheY-like chemotaxis protein|uniref:response regulator n=1 Tax=Novosphingobium sp. PhB57 TaxID=2485107 RepID=UPI001044CD4D|nr:response regulator [Novosphingobium sp. PhB57]TCU58180.1 response regulator receiver domain-containing protein [Novosphingobium sp. PhB57]